MNVPVTVIIVDSDTAYAGSLARIIDNCGGFSVKGIVSDEVGFLGLLSELCPNIAIIRLKLRCVYDMFNLVFMVKELSPTTAIVMTGIVPVSEEEATLLGVDGYFVGDAEPHQIKATLQRVAKARCLRYEPERKKKFHKT